MSSLEIRNFFNDSNGAMTTITYRCPCRCLHCGIRAGPDRNEDLDLNLLRKYIEGIFELGFTRLSITGGEPMFYEDGFNASLDLCSKFHISLDVLTNGFWVRDGQKASTVIRRLFGLGGKVVFSVDDFHQQFVPLERVKNGVIISLRSTGYSEIKCVLTQGGGNHAIVSLLKTVIEEFGEFEFSEQKRLNKPFRQTFRFKGAVLKVEYSGIMPFGRAEGIKTNLSFLEYSELGVDCPLSSLNIVPNGDVRPCCSAAGEEFGFLTIGNLNDSSLKEMLIRNRNIRNKVNFFVYAKELWKKRFYNKHEKFVNPCHLCYKLGKKMMGGYQLE
jgi:MoaA/NifB/PqqE/SkfB family radical SAM enzyme